SIPAVATPGNHQFNPKARGFCSSLLKRVAIFQIRLPRFRSLLFRMSLSQNRCSLLRDML
ncbi:hypothetical protein ACC817_35815, partial [Rhizobium ruizarguesonis]